MESVMGTASPDLTAELDELMRAETSEVIPEELVAAEYLDVKDEMPVNRYRITYVTFHNE